MARRLACGHREPPGGAYGSCCGDYCSRACLNRIEGRLHGSSPGGCLLVVLGLLWGRR